MLGIVLRVVAVAFVIGDALGRRGDGAYGDDHQSHEGGGRPCAGAPASSSPLASEPEPVSCGWPEVVARASPAEAAPCTPSVLAPSVTAASPDMSAGEPAALSCPPVVAGTSLTGGSGGGRLGRSVPGSAAAAASHRAASSGTISTGTSTVPSAATPSRLPRSGPASRSFCPRFGPVGLPPRHEALGGLGPLDVVEPDAGDRERSGEAEPAVEAFELHDLGGERERAQFAFRV